MQSFDDYRSVTHIALNVADVPYAEGFYTGLFGLSIAFREVDTVDGWRTVTADANWDNVRAAGFRPGLSFMYRDGFGLAVEWVERLQGDGSLSHVGLCVSPQELGRLRTAAPGSGCQVVADRANLIVFVDPLGVQWELTDVPYADPIAQSNGVRRGRWLEL